MIYINRNNIGIPKFFSSDDFRQRNSELLDFYNKLGASRAQKKGLEFQAPPEILNALYKLFGGKCAYCESQVELPEFGDGSEIAVLDHFRPRFRARGFTKEASALDHYWWLTWVWENMYLSCRECNSSKSTWFPVEGRRASIKENYSSLILIEKSLMLDPCNDVVEDHLDYNLITGTLIGKSKRGKTTIAILGLNRNGLVDSRLRELKKEERKWRNMIRDYDSNNSLSRAGIEKWQRILNDNSQGEFIGLKRAIFLKKYGESGPVLQGHLSQVFGKKSNNSLSAYEQNDEVTTNVDIGADEASNREDTTLEKTKSTKPKLKGRQKEIKSKTSHEENIDIRALLKKVYIERIELKNYKCFDFLDVRVPKKSVDINEPWVVFLGENGVGKSSLIRAVAIALMGQDYLDKLNLDASKILKYNKKSGYIKVFGSNKDELYEVTFDKNSNRLNSNIKEAPCYLLGYGSTRLLPKGALQPESNITYVKTSNLFDYSVSLDYAKEWLLEIDKIEFDQVALSLKDLLLLGEDDIIGRNRINKSIFINNPRNDIEDLSDGYKSIFAITGDIIKTLSKDNLAFQTAEAIILIDEIGTHLHPRWKMEVVNRLRRTFPKMQFIITTHEPLCLRGLRKNEVSVLKRDDDGRIIAINDLPNPSDFRVDQLLTSEYFGLNSTLDFETEALFKEYYNLLAKENRSNEEQNRVSELNQILPNKRHIGDDIRDELVYYVIDELLAKQVKKEGFKMANDKIKKQALDRVKDIWNFIDNND